MSLKNMSDLLKQYDINILWMAVECGEEKTKPKDISGLNQYILWGIPGKPFIKNSIDSSLAKGDYEQYENQIMNELKWLNENKNIIIPDKDLLKQNGIDNSVNTKADYVLKNGIKIYGVQITGPTKELLKLQKENFIRFEEVKDIGFWFWH
ncbi:MAG: anti sigma factor C-terminal domain-containing protein [Clostridiaceae bacterium]|nr:anti sigma factor C-terminal domain-containing protein [Clostridiaceae bacterium]